MDYLFRLVPVYTQAIMSFCLVPLERAYALQNKIKKIMWHNLFEKNYAPFIKNENLLVPSEYLASYIASAHFGVVQEWLENGCRETPEEMAKILSNLTFRGPLTAAGIR